MIGARPVIASSVMLQPTEASVARHTTWLESPTVEGANSRHVRAHTARVCSRQLSSRSCTLAVDGRFSLESMSALKLSGLLHAYIAKSHQTG